MEINTIFKSIQGEGKYVGQPALFIRLSGCTRSCSFCDTKYHTESKTMSVQEVVDKINENNLDYVVWTGGEPMLQEKEICEVINETLHVTHHLETNGDILPESPEYFTYIAFSPKKQWVAKNVCAFCAQLGLDTTDWDIKIVTDLKINKELFKYATMLMPLTTFDEEKDKKIQQDVWNYCVNADLNYSPRLHVDVWGNKRGI